jgi:hypothetical protein
VAHRQREDALGMASEDKDAAFGVNAAAAAPVPAPKTTGEKRKTKQVPKSKQQLPMACHVAMLPACCVLCSACKGRYRNAARRRKSPHLASAVPCCAAVPALHHRTILCEARTAGAGGGGSLPKMLKISNGICELTVDPTGL